MAAKKTATAAVVATETVTVTGIAAVTETATATGIAAVTETATATGIVAVTETETVTATGIAAVTETETVTGIAELCLPLGPEAIIPMVIPADVKKSKKYLKGHFLKGGVPFKFVLIKMHNILEKYLNIIYNKNNDG